MLTLSGTWYCSAACQKEHFEKHRDVCKAVAFRKKQVREQKLILRSSATIDLYEMELVGFMWHWEFAHPYLEATFHLADAYFCIAYDCEVKEVWETALFHYLEHLRLGANDRLGARRRVPFILLYLNRDDDANNFVRYWVPMAKEARVEEGALFRAHANTQEGDWIYPCETDCRYRDIFQQYPGVDPNQVALLIIKFRSFMAHCATVDLIELAMEESTGRRIQEVDFAITAMLIREDIDFENQLEQIYRLMDALSVDGCYSFSEFFRDPCYYKSRSASMSTSSIRLHSRSS